MCVFVCIYIDINYDIRRDDTIERISSGGRTWIVDPYYTIVMQSYYTESHVICVAMGKADRGAGENEKRVQRRETMK